VTALLDRLDLEALTVELLADASHAGIDDALVVASEVDGFDGVDNRIGPSAKRDTSTPQAALHR